MSLYERIHYTPDGKGFTLYGDDGSDHEVKNFADVYNKDKFLELMKKGGKARDWVARHNLFGYYVKPTDYETKKKLTKAEAQLLALPRYMSDESWYDEDNYFWIQIDGFEKPLISQLRISNHNTVHKQYEKSHSNDKSVDCQTCLNVVIGDKAYNRDKFNTYAVGDDAIVSVETFFDEDNRTPEQIEFFEDFVEKVRSGSQPSITMDEIRTYIDPNARVVISQGGAETTASLANIRPSQYAARKIRVVTRYNPRDWNAEKENTNFEIPKAIPYSDVSNGDTGEEYVDRKDKKAYNVFVYNGKRFAFDYGELVAYYIKSNGNLSKDNPIEILDENKRKRYNILEDKYMKIYTKKNNGLRKLGEGRIYSKSQLRLNEFTNGKVSLTLNPNGQDVRASSVQTSAQNMLHQVPQATAVTIQSDDIDGVSAPTFSSSDPRNDTVQNIAAKNANGATIQQAAKNGGAIQITKDDQQSDGLSESRINEMRKSSIPFTKGELNNFLRNL
jgi:hypothetical protein